MKPSMKDELAATRPGMALQPGPDLAQGIWRLADPKITLASAASMFLGASLAAHAGPLAWGPLALTVLGIFCLEAAKNASGEIFDFDSGTDAAVLPEDRSPFSGGKRVLVDGLLTRRQTVLTAAAFYLLGSAAGLAIVLVREPAVLWLGAVGVGLAFFYHAPPLKLAYRGLGELTVALTYGPLIGCGTYLVQRQALPVQAMLLMLPLGLLIGAFLWVNEFPDYLADRSAGKRTLVVRLGRVRAAQLFGLVLGLAYLGLLLLPLAGLPRSVWLGLVGLPLAVAAARRVLSSPEATARIVPAQGWALLSFVLMALGSGAGLLLERFAG
jgi:1,4-dihydroxy-2-naphthoate polyprenyltransferase